MLLFTYWHRNSRLVKKMGHEVFSVYEEARGLDDNSIIQKAGKENYILITNDKDFGEKVFKENQNIKE